MKPATTYVVPKRTPEATCKGCDEPIYWIVTPNDRRMPVDCEAAGCYPPTDREDGLGVSHFTTCPKANQFSKGGKKP